MVFRPESNDEIDMAYDTHANNTEPKRARFVHELCQKSNQTHERDLSQKAMVKQMFHQSDLYIWLVLMMAVFYGLPAIQLVFKYQEALAFTGNNDLCYYNFLCSLPMGKLQDFNHILSNMGYIFFGITFLAIILIRQVFL